MNENAKKWVEALESGEYEQGRTYLRHNDRFCCLGVACDLYLKDGGVLKPSEGRATAVEVEPDGVYRYGRGQLSILPPEVMEYLGVRDSSGAFEAPGGVFESPCETDTLTMANDRGEDFKQIAKIIRREPEGLFVN